MTTILSLGLNRDLAFGLRDEQQSGRLGERRSSPPDEGLACRMVLEDIENTQKIVAVLGTINVG